MSGDLFRNDNASIEADSKIYYYRCEVKNCGERARICVNAYDYGNGIGRNNNFYMCVEHFTKLRHLMNADRDVIKERYEFEKNFLKRFKI